MTTPRLRFPEFDGPYSRLSFEDLFNFSSGKNIKQDEAAPNLRTPCVRYGELYHLYSEVITEVVNRTDLPPENLVFSEGNEILLPSAGEDPMDIGSASALTVKNVAIGRTINILKPKTEGVCSPIYVSYYINHVLRKPISKLARGVSISNVYNSDLKRLFLDCPTFPEQKKIATFLGAVDAKVVALRSKVSGLETYKRGLMQALFSQRLRFSKPDGTAFPDWRIQKLHSVLRVKGIRNTDGLYSKEDVLSVSGEFGIVNQIEHLGRSYAGVSVDNYHVVETGDIVYTKSPLKSNPFGIIKANRGNPGIVSTLYAVYEVRDGYSFDYLDRYFELDSNTNKYLAPLVHKGAKNDMKINNDRVLIGSISIPSFEEQQKIASALANLDAKIRAVRLQIAQIETYKKGLLEQMFV
ncbi:restriction endonuclease subunit S [Neorhizobium tomejilense]|uniref:restriction endonuclease subunit S n=1 Tax=Neorhizobium tomejilense TaxID=2093828 RepID=UPI000E6BBE6A|nr:restriction endonuclease subunit S [Neorhizobium tomejilense]